MTGPFEGTATFGPGEAARPSSPARQQRHLRRPVRLERRAGLGKHAGGTGSDQGFGIATDGAGNSHVIGEFLGTATFGAGEANETMLTPAAADIFVARFAAAETELTLTAEKDSFLRRGNPDRNEGANPGLRLQATRRPGRGRVRSGRDRRLRHPDHRDPGPDHRRDRQQLGPDNNRTVDAHPLVVDFAEGNGKKAGVPAAQSTRGSGPGVTWNCAIDAQIANPRPDCAPEVERRRFRSGDRRAGATRQRSLRRGQLGRHRRRAGRRQRLADQEDLRAPARPGELPLEGGRQRRPTSRRA